MRIKPLALALYALCSAPVLAAPSFVNGIAIPGDSLDRSGDPAAIDRRVGFFSDIYYDPNRREWWGLSDRGPGGGFLSYETRVQRFTFGYDTTSGAIAPGSFQILETLKFTNGAGPLNGKAPSPTNVLGNAFDPEGLVINPLNGNLLVSDEYGPSLYEFNRSGQLLRTFNGPANVVPRNGVTGVPNFADDAGNTAGKRTNRGYEGLAVSPDGQHTFAMLQSAMLDEGAGDGVYNRIVKFDNATGNAVAQYAYKMEGSSQGRGISSLVAINSHEFMVLERNNRGVGVGADASPPNKKVYLIDTDGATDVTGETLPPGAGDPLPPGVVPVSKDASTFIDLAANTLAELGNKVPEKWEGLAIGPQLSDGSYLILAGTDNDYSVTQNQSAVQFDVYFRFSDADPYLGSIQCPLGEITGCVFTDGGAAATLTSDYALLPGVLHAYKVSAADLAAYVKPVPEPETLVLMLAGFGLLGLTVVRRRL
jgi:hypothetical protein